MPKKPTYKELEQKLKKMTMKLSEFKQTEKSFRGLGISFYTLLDYVNDGVYVLNEQGYFVFVNKVIEQRAAIPFDRFVGLHFLDIVDPRYQVTVQKNFEQVLKGRQVDPFEVKYTTPDGKSIVIETNPEAIYHDDKITGILGVSRDISKRKLDEEALKKAQGDLEKTVAKRTNHLLNANKKLKQEIQERKKAEKALIESEERYRSVFEGASEGILLADVEKKVMVFANPAICNMLGYTREELIGLPILKLHPKKALKTVCDEFDALAQKKKTKALDIPFLRKDGSMVYTDVGAAHILIGRRTYLAGFFTDITSKKQAEESRFESENRFRTLVETMNDGLAVRDKKGNLTYVNDRFCEMLGYGKEELIGRPPTKFLDPANRRIFKAQQSEQHMAAGKSHEMTWTAKDGRKISTLVSPASIRNEQDEITGSFAVISDISILKEVEKELKLREKELRINTGNLEEANIALRVLLKKRHEDKTDLEEQILYNIKELVEPYLKKLRHTKLDEKQQSLLGIVESHIREIASPFSRGMSLKFLNLTPTEIQIANLIKHGKKTKEIAEYLNVSYRTVDTHRKNIRKKIGLDKKRANLRSHLLTFR